MLLAETADICVSLTLTLLSFPQLALLTWLKQTTCKNTYTNVKATSSVYAFLTIWCSQGHNVTSGQITKMSQSIKLTLKYSVQSLLIWPFVLYTSKSNNSWNYLVI